MCACTKWYGARLAAHDISISAGTADAYHGPGCLRSRARSSDLRRALLAIKCQSDISAVHLPTFEPTVKPTRSGLRVERW